MQLTEEQQTIKDSILRCLRAGQDCSLTGLAGTGKTTLLAAIKDELGPSATVMAPTGKAAMVLRTKGIEADTIHRVIYNFRGKKENDKGETELIFHRKNDRLHGVKYLIVDESSMVTDWVARDIYTKGLPVLWVGDPGQLPPVKSGPSKVLSTEPHFHLKTIHRQAAGSPIIRFAHHLRKGGSLCEPFGGIEHFKVNGGGAKAIIRKMIESGIDRLIVKTNEQRVMLNKTYREEVFGGQATDPLIDDDEIICLANNRHYGVVNGQVMTCLKSWGDVGFVRLETGQKEEIRFHIDQFNQSQRLDVDDLPEDVILADYAYAVTCHKFQGSSAGHVGIIAKGWCGNDEKRWNYTAATRAEERITVFC